MGQYVDGHEQEDIIIYCQTQFLPTITELEWNMHSWKDGMEELTNIQISPQLHNHHMVVWWHDESTFYTNDQQKTYWVHKDEKAVPQPKGEGISLMVADFVSADYGWLQSPNGKEEPMYCFEQGRHRRVILQMKTS
jgi:hypothetical protein